MASQHDKRNIAFYAGAEGVWGFHAAMVATGTVFTVILRHFGASETMLGWLLAIEIGTVNLLQFLGMFVFKSKRHRRRHLMFWHLFVMIPFWFVIANVISFSHELSPVTVRWLILLSFAGFYSALGVVMASWANWVAHLFNRDIRGTAMGLSFGAFSLMGVGGAWLAGKMIEVFPKPDVYGYIFLVGGALAAASINIYWMLRDPAEHEATVEERPDVKVVARKILVSLRDRNFRQYLIARALTVAGFCLSPLLTVYYTSEQGGNVSDSAIVTYGAAVALGTALSSLLLGRIGDLRGHRIGVITGAAAQTVAVAIVLFSGGHLSCLAAFLCAGICNGAGVVAHQNMLFESCPHDNRFAHITVGNLIVGIVGVIAAPLSGFAANQWGLMPLFVSCLILSAVGLIWFAVLVKEPRDVEVNT